jgi:hypothetical protein
MAPEQLEGQEADARSDIFAFGAVLYEMVTGRKAFTGKTQASLIHAILGVDPPPLSTVQPLTPPALDHVVETCLEKDPDDRFHTAHDLLVQLKWIAEAGSKAGVAAPVVVRRRTRDRLAAAAAGAVVVGAMTGAAGWMLKPDPPRQIARFALTLPEGEPLSASGRHLVALSPDGTRLVYVANQRLNVRALDQFAVRRAEAEATGGARSSRPTASGLGSGRTESSARRR